MARVTVEDCLARIPNRFALTILAARRARALSEGRGRAMVDCDNKEGVTALREISSDRVRFREEVDSAIVDFIEEQRRQLRVTTAEHTFLEAASLRALEEEDVELDDEVEEEELEELTADPEAISAKVVPTDDAEEGVEPETEDEDEAGFAEADAEFPADDAEELPDDGEEASTDEPDAE